MPNVSRKKNSLLRERLQLKAGTVVVVFRDDQRVKPLLGFVIKAIVDNGALLYRVKLFDNPKNQKFTAKQVLPVVEWRVSEDGVSRTFEIVPLEHDPVKVEDTGTQVAD